MFRPLSPLDMVQRVDVNVDDGVLASGLIGSWVTIYGSTGTANEGKKWNAGVDITKARFASTAYKPVWVIWTEGMKRSTTVGSQPADYTSQRFTPDAIYTKKLTTLVGKWRAMTDMVAVGTAKTPGTLLCPDPSSTSGKLMALGSVNISGLLETDSTMTVYSGLACAVVRNYYSWLDHMGVTYSGVWEIENLI